MRNLFILVVVLVCGSMLAGCGDVKGTPVEYAKACDVENEKKVIEVSGYLSDRGSVFCSNIGGGPVRCGFTLLDDPGEKKGFTADIPAGSYANNAEKPERGYKKEDLKVRDNAGNILNLAEKVKLTGTMNVSKNASMPESDVCFLTVAKIEKH